MRLFQPWGSADLKKYTLINKNKRNGSRIASNHPFESSLGSFSMRNVEAEYPIIRKNQKYMTIPYHTMPNAATKKRNPYTPMNMITS